MGFWQCRLEELVVKDIFDCCYSGKKVLLTGNTGFKGGWLSIWLAQLGAKVTGFSKDIPSNPSFFKALNIEKRLVKQYWSDVRHYESVQEAVSNTKPDIVFHLAAQPLVKRSVIHPLETFQTNTIGTANVLTAVMEYCPQVPVVLITSDKCYQNNEWLWGYRENDRLGGTDPYSASKAAAELIFSSFTQTYPNITACSARAGNVIGGGDWAENRIIPDAVTRWQNDEILTVRSPKATRPWQHVLEPLGGYLSLGRALLEGKRNLSSESFNFGPSATRDYSVEELLQLMVKYWPSDLRRVELLENSGIEAGLLKLNCDKARAVLGWEQVWGIEKTVEQTAVWYRNFYDSGNMDDITLQQINSYSQSWIENCD